MGTFPFGYVPVEATTWAYLSSLLMLALFFKFNRFWSFRNFDLGLIILLAPGLLMVHYGNNPPESVLERFNVGDVRDTGVDGLQDEFTGAATDVWSDRVSAAGRHPVLGHVGSADLSSRLNSAWPRQDESDMAEPYNQLEQWQRRLKKQGFLWLFGIGAVWVIRMLIDPSLIRKPFLESNLSSGGLMFLACSLMIFLFANIITSPPQQEDLMGPMNALKIVQGEEFDSNDLRRYGPGYALFNIFPTISTFANDRQMLREDADTSEQMNKYVTASKIMAIVSQIAIVLALVFFGRNHFDDLRIGIGMATIYLMLPYTAQMTGRVMHLLPAALLVWSITLYRLPAVAGAFLGLAASVAYYPLFLIPLFASFYWKRGRTRFFIGLFTAIGVAVASLMFTSQSWETFWYQLQAMFGFWTPISQNLKGIWELGWHHAFRFPFLVGFIVMCVSFAVWPAQKTLASLLSCSCAAMIAVQFWHGFDGGLYMGWYLPLALLVFFRPNLQDRSAEVDIPKDSPATQAAGPKLTAA